MSDTETTQNPPPQPGDDDLSMGIDPFERNWMRFGVVMLAVFALTVAIGGFAMGFDLPGDEGQVDPNTVLDTEPWDEPGLREVAPGVYEAYVIAQTWSFVPREMEVPVGSEVTIYVTSPDLQHGFKIRDTNVNMQIVPGQVSKLTYTFDELGEFPYICHEYCGRGHAAMFGVVNVVPDTPSSASGDTGAGEELNR